MMFYKNCNDNHLNHDFFSTPFLKVKGEFKAKKVDCFVFFSIKFHETLAEPFQSDTSHCTYALQRNDDDKAIIVCVYASRMHARYEFFVRRDTSPATATSPRSGIRDVIASCER